MYKKCIYIKPNELKKSDTFENSYTAPFTKHNY